MGHENVACMQILPISLADYENGDNQGQPRDDTCKECSLIEHEPYEPLKVPVKCCPKDAPNPYLSSVCGYCEGVKLS